MEINCMIIDDEPLAIELIEDFISRVPFLKLLHKCENAADGIQKLQAGQVDLLFLDIKMPDITGIELLKSLRNPPLVIFTTAYDQYAVEGFNLDVLDYLLKPVPFERFLRAVTKANEYLTASSRKEPESKDFIFIKSDYRILKLNLDDILYIEGLKDYVKIFIKNEKPVLSLQTIKSIEVKLPSNRFVRVHRSYIISLDKINSIARNRIIIGNEYIPVSDSYKDIFYSIINNFS